ncbi:MAG: AtpZ/AtpI family protein [Pseudomonadota bacterium]
MSEKSSGAHRGSGTQKLSSLEQRISAAKKAREPERRDRSSEFTAASMAWRLIIELVVSVMVGAAMGWGLDALFGTLPLFLIVFVLLGFASGVRTMLRSATEMQRRMAQRAEDEKRG